MEPESVLVVDDEKNIRLTLRESLKPLGLDVDTAINGEEPLAMAAQKKYHVVLLDLKMPGMDGMEVLRRLRDSAADMAVVLLTAHGSIESAVEAMKLGAVDFLQKPFAPQEIRDIVSRAMGRRKTRIERAGQYELFVTTARQQIGDGLLDEAVEHLKTAIAIHPGRPEAFNLLGAACEMQHDADSAARYYRAAYWLDPTYEPSRLNIERDDIGTAPFERIHLGSDR